MNGSEKIIQVPGKFIWIPVFVILGFTLVATLALLHNRISNPLRAQVTVSGEGHAFMRPDIAVARLAVRTERAVSPAEALTDNKKKMNNVLALLKKEGIEEKDIQTSEFQMYPEYNYDKGKRTQAGFTVSQEVQVKIRDVEKIGTVLEKATGAGVNTIGQLSFDIDDPETIKAEARAKAIAKAQEQARNMVEAAGARLGKLLSISENANVPRPRPIAYGLGGGGEMAMSVEAPDIEPGQQEIVVYVNLTYELK